MKILLIANHGLVLYVFRRELLERLIADGHQVVTALPEDEYTQDLKAMGCKVIPTVLHRHGTNPVQDLQLLMRYKQIIRAEKPDKVLTYTIKPNIYGGMASAAAKVPYVVNITGLGTAVEKSGALQKLTVLLYRYALRRVQTVFFQNRDNEAFFAARKLAMGKHKMLPGSGVNLERFQVLPYPDGGTVDFVFVARVMREKGIDQYLDAAKALRKKYPQARFHICGFCEEAYEDTIRQLEAQGIVRYHGLVKDIQGIYRMARCTVHPTFYPEGLSNVLLESAASGRPIITTNRPGCREVIEDGVNGFLVEERSSADLIQKLERFLQLSWQEQKQMGLNGRKKVEKEFDRRIVVEAYIKELNHGL